MTHTPTASERMAVFGTGFACAPLPPTVICAPILCGGGSPYPTCDGSCVAGASCRTIMNGGVCEFVSDGGACNPMTCPLGCCQGDLCLPAQGQHAMSCGSNGSVCAFCPPPNVCRPGMTGGICSPPFDGGM